LLFPIRSRNSGIITLQLCFAPTSSALILPVFTYPHKSLSEAMVRLILGYFDLIVATTGSRLPESKAITVVMPVAS
jgi:hypothetical protein